MIDQSHHGPLVRETEKMSQHAYRATMDLVFRDRKKIIDRAVELEIEQRGNPITIMGGAVYRSGKAFLDDGETLVPVDQLRDHYTKVFDDAVAMVWQWHMEEFFEQFDCDWRTYNVEEVEAA
jgi:uncharacterized glyoxalase superfamily metalloenzyme YdcJ